MCSDVHACPFTRQQVLGPTNCWPVLHKLTYSQMITEEIVSRHSIPPTRFELIHPVRYPLDQDHVPLGLEGGEHARPDLQGRGNENWDQPQRGGGGEGREYEHMLAGRGGRGVSTASRGSALAGQRFVSRPMAD